QQLLIGGQEDIYVSLPQDSLTQLGKRVDTDKDVQKIARNKVIDVLWIMIPLMFLACAVTFWATRNFGGSDRLTPEMEKKLPESIEKESEKAATEAARRTRLNMIRPIYNGQLARVAQALQAENALVAQQTLMGAPAMRSTSDAKTRDVR